MHNPLKFISVFLVFLIVSCQGTGFKMEECEYEEGGKRAEIIYPVFSKDDGINNEIRKTVDSVLNNFLLYSAKNSTLKMDSEIKHKSENIISIIIEGELKKEDDSHPEKLRYPLTYDLKGKRVLALSDILDGTDWHNTVNNIMKERVETNKEYEELWETPTVEILEKENFYIDDGKIIIFYPPYKLSYYNRGFVDFAFSKDDLRGYLTDYAKNHL